MSEQRSRMLLDGNLNSNPLLYGVDEFTPPHVELVTEEARGGKFVPEDIIVGLSKLECEIKIPGLSRSLRKSYGASVRSNIELDVKSSEMDAEGNDFAIAEELTGKIVSIKDDPAKMGSKPMATIKMTLVAYKRTENGEICYDINTKTQKVDLGDGDIMEAHRRNVGRP